MTRKRRIDAAKEIRASRVKRNKVGRRKDRSFVVYPSLDPKKKK